MMLQCGGAVLLTRWCLVLKATIQVNVMSWQDVASEVAHFMRVCVLVSPTDTTSALIITVVTFVALCETVAS